VARELDVPRQLLSKWLERASELGAPGAPPLLKEDERAELLRLRQEVARLKEEKVILKKAAAFFAKESL
jgi:transposase